MITSTRVRQNDKGKFGYINDKGEFIIPEIYEEARSFSHGHAPVKNADGWGVISPKNQTLVEFSWDEVMDVTNPDPGKIWVRKDSLWHALNIADNTSAFQTTFKPTGNFSTDGYAPVCDGSKFGLINTFGELVVPIGLSHESLLEKCISDMKERGISSLKPIDVYRYNISVNPQKNMFRLLDRVDDEMWDF